MAKPSQEQQDTYDIFVSQGIDLAMQDIETKSVQGDASPEIIADIMIGIITRLEQKGKQSGVTFPLDVVQKGGTEILTALLGLAKIEPEPELVKQVTAIVVGKYMKTKSESGEITPEQMQQIADGGEDA